MFFFQNLTAELIIHESPDTLIFRNRVVLIFWKLSVLIFLKSTETKLLLTIVSSNCRSYINPTALEDIIWTPSTFEALIHKLFDGVKLQVTVDGRHPKEWFIVPFKAIEEVVNAIIAGKPIEYNPQFQQIIYK